MFDDLSEQLARLGTKMVSKGDKKIAQGKYARCLGNNHVSINLELII